MSAAIRRAEVLQKQQAELLELVAEIALLGGYWQGYAHACSRTGCSLCRSIVETEAAA